MVRRLDQFCDDIRLKLSNIETGLFKLRAKTEGKAERAELEVRAHLDSVRRRIEQGRAKTAAAGAEIGHWADEKMSVTSEQIAQLRMNGDATKLQGRADKADRYAAATADVAAAALDRAEAAALEAWLAWQDVKTAQRIASGDVG